MPMTRALIQACASEVAKDCGLVEFPFKPAVVASVSGITIEGRPDMNGATGAISLKDDPVIFHPRDMSDDLLNFTLGHELGHYFLSGHPEQIISDGGMHLSRGGAFEYKKTNIEREADYFSANFLMPSSITKKFLDSESVGLEGILKLHQIAITSITSSAIRTVQCDPYPVAIVLVGSGGEVKYSYRSSSFTSSVPGRTISKNSGIPIESAAFRIAQDATTPAGERALEQSNSRVWFGQGNKRLEVETIHLGKHGTLVVLSGEENWEEDEEEADLIASWTPRFKR